MRDLDEEGFVGRLMKEKTDLRNYRRRSIIINNSLNIFYIQCHRVRDLDDEGFVGRLRKEKTDLRTLQNERTYCGAPK